jgi:hypothetical protein
MANDPDRGAGHSDEPDDWAGVLEDPVESPATLLPPAAATRPSAQPPEITGVRIRSPGIKAAITGAPAPVTNRPIVPRLADDDLLDGRRTATMPTTTQLELLRLERELGDDRHPPTPADRTLPPGERPSEEGVARGQGVPGDSANRPPGERRETIPGTGTPSTPRIGQPVDFRARTPAFGMTGDPSYRGPIVAEVREEPEEALDTVRPPRNEYGPTVREFRSDSQRDELGRPDHQLPPPHDEHADDPVVIPYTDVPSAGLIALFPDELPHGEPLEPDTGRDVDMAFAQIVMDDAQVPPSSEAVAGPTPQPALPERARWIEQGLWLLAWSLVWLFSLSQRTRRLLLGVATLILVILTAVTYHLADNWWYYNPF